MLWLAYGTANSVTSVQGRAAPYDFCDSLFPNYFHFLERLLKRLFYLTGVISISSYSLGCLIGGYITKKWDMSPYKTLLLIISLVGIVTAILVGAAFLGCGHQDIYNTPTEQSYVYMYKQKRFSGNRTCN